MEVVFAGLVAPIIVMFVALLTMDALFRGVAAIANWIWDQWQ